MSTLANQTSGMAVGTLLSRITGIVRDIALVAAIGTGVFSDSYSVANSVPNIIYILIAGGAINAVFVPALVRHMNDDEDAGARFADALLTIVSAVLFIVVLITMAVAPFIAHLYGTSQWSTQDFDVATYFARWCLPQIFFYGLYTLASQVLNARGVFKLPMYAPIVNNVVVIATAGLFIAISTGEPTSATVLHKELFLLGFGTTLGVVVQALILLPALGKAGYNFRPNFSVRGSGLGKVGDLAIWTIGFVFVNQLSFLVISRLTTYANVVSTNAALTPVGFTSYQKAQLMMMLPHSIITVSLITAVLPRLSRQAHAHDEQAFDAELTHAVRLVMALMVPSAALLVIAGPRIGQFLYGHGASTLAQGNAVGFVSSMFAIGLPAFSLFYVLLRSFYARENTKTPFFINLAFNMIHVGVGTILFFFVADKYKVASLAFAYSIGYTVVCLYTWNLLSRKQPGLRRGGHLQLLVRLSVATLVATFVAEIIMKVLPSASAHTTIALLEQLIIMATSFIGSFFVIARAMHIDEVGTVLTSLMSRKGN